VQTAWNLLAAKLGIARLLSNQQPLALFFRKWWILKVVDRSSNRLYLVGFLCEIWKSRNKNRYDGDTISVSSFLCFVEHFVSLNKQAVHPISQ
jgi:hypothetical protein